jgi:hypothetical protein
MERRGISVAANIGGRAVRIPPGGHGWGDLLLASAGPVARQDGLLVLPPESVAVLGQSI